jgi:HEAT repeat protein
VPELTKLLTTTKHSHVLIQALLALASIGPQAATAEPQIDTVLKTSKDATVPVAAAYALGSIGAKDSEAALKAAAATKDNEFLRMTATWALAKLHPEDQAAMKAAVDVLTHGLKSDKVAMRNAAAKSLQSLHAPPEMVTPALVELMKDPSPEMHANAVEAIASLGESVVPKLIKGLKNPQLRTPAVRVITKIGPKAADAVQPLIEEASNNNAEPKLKTEIYFALAAIGPAAAPATDMLVKAITSKDQGERESALFALRKIGPGAKAAVKPLVERMNADDSFDADAAAWALSRIAPNDAEVVKVVVPKLTKGLSAKDEQSRIESIEALAEIGPAAASASSALEHAAKEDSSPVVRDAAEAALHPKSGDK